MGNHGTSTNCSLYAKLSFFLKALTELAVTKGVVSLFQYFTTGIEKDDFLRRCRLGDACVSSADPADVIVSYITVWVDREVPIYRPVPDILEGALQMVACARGQTILKLSAKSTVFTLMTLGRALTNDKNINGP